MRILDHRSRLILASLLADCGVARLASAQGTILPPALELRVPTPPTLGTGENGSFLVYELHVTNVAASPITRKSVDVLTGDASWRPVFTLADRAQGRHKHVKADCPESTRTRFAPAG